MNRDIGSREKGSRSTQLRAFFSVDLVGGTAFKNRGVSEEFSSARSWPNRFQNFFQEFIQSFREGVITARAGTEADIAPPPHLWKINGDELLFTELVYEDREQRHAALATSLRTFVELVHETDERFIGEGLGVRACAWTAGFPLRNKRVRIAQGGIPLIDSGRFDPETGPATSSPVTVTDFIGRDMDIGFRLAAGAPPGRIVCSLDLAHFAMDLPIRSGLTVWHVGWSPLKGVLDGKPYPLFWLEDERPRRARHPWDEWTGDHSTAEILHFLGADAEPLTKEKFSDLEQRVRALAVGQMITPYASLDEMPEQDAREYDDEAGIDPTRELRAEAELESADFAVSPGHAETITLDDLNQLHLRLQDFPDEALELRQILMEIANHHTYAAWESEHQFSGDLFRLHPTLNFASKEKRYLLESRFLVKDDALRVKINLCQDQVFITDGLWVDPSIRAFPFSDESDLVIRGCREEGWMDWATCVIDPAVGCGHNLLRCGSKGARLYGFDRNSRALAYAGINARLNGFEDVTLGNRDIRSGIPPVFGRGRSEKVLVLANMPFALVPNRDEIARSADGGRHGFEQTVALLEAVSLLSQQLDPASELRCVVLSYSVGTLGADTWAVPERAAEIFGRSAMKWKLWPGEKLWRVNGKKEQENPMPLSRLKLKADCRFYVRGNVSAEKLRRDYEILTDELRDEGYDHLAYGVLTGRVGLRKRLHTVPLESEDVTPRADPRHTS